MANNNYISFFWKSDLTAKEREQIKSWVNSLSKNEFDLFVDLFDKYLADARAEARWDAMAEFEN